MADYMDGGLLIRVLNSLSKSMGSVAKKCFEGAHEHKAERQKSGGRSVCCRLWLGAQESSEKEYLLEGPGQALNVMRDWPGA